MAKKVKGLAYYGKWPVVPKPIPPAPAGPIPDGLAVLILCAGDMHIWEGDEPRQLRPIAGEPILLRIIRQVRKSKHEPTIITHRDDIQEATPDVAHFEPEHRRTIAETWLYTRELWKKQTVVLLGDVIYGPITIRKILAHRGSMMMVGNSAEIFAFTFPKGEHNRVARALHHVNQVIHKAAPWGIYRHWCGFPYKSGQRENKVFHWVWDRTSDIDLQREYNGAKGVWG